MRVPLTWRDVIFVASITSVSVISSFILTYWQFGWNEGMFTSVIIPLVIALPVSTWMARQNARIIALNRQLNELVRRDPLTGLLNRRAFLAVVEASPAGVLIMLDADYFKVVNDTWGHPAGDAVLVDLAARLGRSAGPVAALGRLGGEEFAAFIPRADPVEGALVAERMRQAVAGAPVMHGATAIPCTVSIGVARLAPGEGGVVAALVAADAALYRAKEAGRNRVIVSGPPIQAAEAPPAMARRGLRSAGAKS